MITFKWEKGTAADAMKKALANLGITMYHNLFFTPCIYINGEELKLDYRHIGGSNYEIVQKISNYREEPTFKSIEL